jgi:hypothetical protein
MLCLFSSIGMRNTLFALGLGFVLSARLTAQSHEGAMVWAIDRLTSIGGHQTEVLGEPRVIGSALGSAVEFDGVGAALVVEANPVAGATEFTIEVIFRPYASSDPANVEQRFIHLQDSEEHRLLIELRLTDDHRWFLDTYIKSGDSARVLYAKAFTHPIGPWYHAALVYQDGEMRHFVNGVLEMSGRVNYVPMIGGRTSVGARLNRHSWYKGAIHELRVTPIALEPSLFSRVPGVALPTGAGTVEESE